jgi:hypothetical protein
LVSYKVCPLSQHFFIQKNIKNQDLIMMSNKPTDSIQPHPPAPAQDNANPANNLLAWMPVIFGEKSGVLALLVSLGFGARHYYNRYQAFRKQNLAMQQQILVNSYVIDEYKALHDKTIQQSTTTNLMRSEIFARSRELQSQHPDQAAPHDTLARNLEHLLLASTAEEVGEDAKDALEEAQQTAFNIDHYLQEVDAELSSQKQGPTCVSNSTTRRR